MSEHNSRRSTARRLAVLAALLPVTLLVGCHKKADDNAFLNKTLPRATTHRWVDNWCAAATKGVTRAQAIRLMGHPVRDYERDPYDPQMRWVDVDYDFTLYLDGAHRVVGADAQYDFTTPDKLHQEVPCAMPDGTTKLGVRG